MLVATYKSDPALPATQIQAVSPGFRSLIRMAGMPYPPGLLAGTIASESECDARLRIP